MTTRSHVTVCVCVGVRVCVILQSRKIPIDGIKCKCKRSLQKCAGFLL